MGDFVSDAGFFIDALDGQGGIAFASLRDPDLSTRRLTSIVSSWHLAAPDFEPTPLGNRATGLAAASRVGFQLGLTLDGENEVNFPTIEALAEYVRRLYLGGGGGDGAGGIGPDWPDDDPDGERLALRFERPEYSFAVIADISRYLKEVASLVKNVSSDLSEPPTTRETARKISVDQMMPVREISLSEEAEGLIDYASVCVRHAVRSLQSRLNRFPKTRSAMVSALQDMQSTLLLLESTRSRKFEVLQFSSSADTELLRRPWHYPYLARLAAHNPMDTLAALPVPEFARAEAAKERRRQWRSLKDLFFDCLGNPSLFATAAVPLDRVALFWLAAVVLLSGKHNGPIQPEARDIFYRDVLDWIAQQMPNHAFLTGLEDTILTMGRI